MIKLILDNALIEKYNEYYFQRHPKARKKAIEHPYHPSINVWMVLPRVQMNALKQKWKEFIEWWMDDIGYSGMGLESFGITFITYMPTKRRFDNDNSCPKFIMDGLVESGFIVDDDNQHCKYIMLKSGYDKDNPRTEIMIERA